MTLPILCIESSWDGKRVSKRSVSHLLTLISIEYGVPYVHLFANTESELVHNLRNFNYGFRRGILYLAFHGLPGRIKLNSQDYITIETLAEHMNGRFWDWHIHFGSCATMRADRDKMLAFKRQTGADVISGYTKYVYWMESSAMDLLLLSTMQEYTYPKNVKNKIESNYLELAQLTGLELL